MGIINPSQGFLPPASPDLLSDVAIIANLAHATLGSRTSTNWLGFAADYNLIRDAISRVIPGFENFNARLAAGEILLSAKCSEAARLQNQLRQGEAKRLSDPEA